MVLHSCFPMRATLVVGRRGCRSALFKKSCNDSSDPPPSQGGVRGGSGATSRPMIESVVQRSTHAQTLPQPLPKRQRFSGLCLFDLGGVGAIGGDGSDGCQSCRCVSGAIVKSHASGVRRLDMLRPGRAGDGGDRRTAAASMRSVQPAGRGCRRQTRTGPSSHAHHTVVGARAIS